MMKRIVIAALCLMLSNVANAATKLYTNPCPAPLLTDANYLAGITSITNAVNAGSRIHVSMVFAESDGPGGTLQNHTFYVELGAISIEPNFASGLLYVRPLINNLAQATNANGLVAGSLDTLGNYRFGQYIFGQPPGPAMADSGCYSTTWWGD